MELSLNTRTRLCGVVAWAAFAAGCGGGSSAPAGGWTQPFSPAAVVLGQTGFDQVDPRGTGATPIQHRVGNPAVAADGRLYVSSDNFLLGFDDFDSNGPAAAYSLDVDQALGTSVPAGLSVRGSRLIATAGSQVLIYNSTPPDATPDVFSAAAVGCSALEMKQPESAVLTPKGQLVVADGFNHRVLIWNTVPQSGTLGEADIVLGQRHMETCVANDDMGVGNSGTPTARTMNHPSGVWSDGVRLVVSDLRNHRVLVWDSFPMADDPDSHIPDRVLGQESLTAAAPNGGNAAPSASSLKFPFALDVSAAGELAVADSGNNRVLIWRSFPTANAQPADYVVGQRSFTSGHANDVGQIGVDSTVPSAKTLSQPSGVHFHGRDLIVNDKENKRVLIWREKE